MQLAATTVTSRVVSAFPLAGRPEPPKVSTGDDAEYLGDRGDVVLVALLLLLLMLVLCLWRILPLPLLEDTR